VNKALALFGLAAIFFTPSGVQSATGMAAMQYYAGSWTCTGGTIGEKPGTATVAYTLSDGVMNQLVTVAATGKMKSYALSSSTTYDSKNGRFIQAGVDTNSAWWVTYGSVSGNTEAWTDHLTSSGKPGHGKTVRTNQSSFEYDGYPTVTATKPNFHVSCHRTM
jgi:hypothetical protein